MKRISIFGSTGSIGQASLDVIAQNQDRFRINYLTANKNIGLLRRQIEKFHPSEVAVLDERSAAELKRLVNGSPKVLAGREGLRELARRTDVDVVISSLVGFAGLEPTVESMKHCKTVAIANKETLVVAGEIVTRLSRGNGAQIIPIDSEHSAILQCLAGESARTIDRLILTASGGPFLGVEKKDFSGLTVESALRHPNWKMGSKITIDSATMMNKGLEVIEAHWLFNIPAERIEVIIHPQSIIHSMVEFVDGSVKAQLGMPDMRIPIQYALTYPERIPSAYARIDLAEIGTMTFFKPDNERFECIQLAYDALKAGGTAPTILNAANEIAVSMFLEKRISFDKIPPMIRHALERVPLTQDMSIENIIATDAETRSLLVPRAQSASALG